MRASLKKVEETPRCLEAYNFIQKGEIRAMFIIEFFRVRETDGAHATLDRVEHDTADLDEAKVRARSLFDTLSMPQKPDALRIVDQNGDEVFFWSPENHQI